MNMPSPRRTRNEAAADRLHSAAIHLLRSLRKVDAATGLTAPRLSVLSVLVFAGPRTLGQLAAAEQVRPPTMTRLITGLENEGFVRRTADSADGRLTIIKATRKGEALMWLGRGRRVGDLAARLGAMSKDEVREVERAAELMERLAAASSSPRP